MKIIEKTVEHLLRTNPFYAHFFLSCKIIYSDRVSTAAVGFSNSSIQMIFNREFVESLTYKELGAVVEHETLHLLYEHLSDKIENLNRRLANYAMDISINQYILNLPQGCITVSVANEQLNLQLAHNQSWEYYYDKLKDKLEQMDFEAIDEHLEIDKSKELNPILKDVISKAIQNSKGNTPQVVTKLFNELSKEAKLPWQQILSNFVSRSISTNKITTRKKLNRRFGLDQPGVKKKRELTLGVCVDSSGSISDENYQSFLSEIQRMIQICSKIYLIEADCVVQNVTVLKNKEKIVPVRNSNGGTAYQPAIDKAKSLGCDAIVYMGDGDTADIPVNPGVPFLWVMVGNSKKSGDFGSEVRL